MISMRPRPATVALLMLIALIGVSFASAQQTDLGAIDFPTSGSAAAQQDFIRGVLLLHSFEYDPAAAAFRDAQEKDPGFAMAYWGEAMTYNHPLWAQQDRDAALAALNRLAPTPEERAARAGSEKEREWMGAIDAMYSGTGDKHERDFGYRDAMRRMHEKYPGDHEVAAFYALSILGTSHDGRDFSLYMKSAAIVDRVFEQNPNHPGAAHYMIHSFDDPVHAPLGLAAANAYSSIAPDASHAQHMTSHIFVAMGMWDDVVAANDVARRVQDAQRAEQGQEANGCGHYNSWLQYGYLQQGRIGAATAEMDLCQSIVNEGGTRSNAGYYANMRARQVLDTRQWDGADRWNADVSDFAGAAANYDFTSGYAALQRGDMALARDMAVKLNDAAAPDNAPTHIPILALQLDALLAIQDGDTNEGLELLQRATFLEENMPFEFGPPAVVKPSHELLGEVLLAQEMYEQAAEAFETALGRSPLRTASLVGWAHAAELSGDTATAAEARAALHEIWQHADAGYPPEHQQR